MIRYGEAPDTTCLIGKSVPVYDGDAPWDLHGTEEQAQVAELLAPLPYVPIFYVIGLNYKHHIEEANLPIPEYPSSSPSLLMP